MAKIKDELDRIRKLAKEQANNPKPASFTDVMSRLTGKEYKPLTQVTPYEEVLAHYTLPFPLFPFQVDSINSQGIEDRTGLYFDPGTGKTVTATVMALFKFITSRAERSLVIMPPILLDQWESFLSTIPGITTQIYRGNPAARKQINLGAARFTLVGSQIFKRDYLRFENTFGDETVVIRDEAHDIKNVASENHKIFSRFVNNKAFLLLTGTPISSPEDAYAYIKLIAPHVYRTKGQFMNIHAGERDFFNQVLNWKNLEVLAENMEINAIRVLKEDVLKDLPEVTYTPLQYQLEPGHAALYKKLAEEQLLQIGDGKLDATGVQKLRHALGQIICNYDHFADDPTKRSTCYEVMEQLMEELGPTAKLCVFAVYRMTNRKLLSYLQKYGAVAIYGGQTPTQNKAALEMFIADPETRIAIIQPTSGGIGVDGLQAVCRDGIFLEHPSLKDFNQAVSRLHRSGQKNGVHIRVATALGTLQVRDQQRLLDNDELVNQVIRNAVDLRAAIFGE